MVVVVFPKKRAGGNGSFETVEINEKYFPIVFERRELHVRKEGEEGEGVLKTASRRNRGEEKPGFCITDARKFSKELVVNQ